MFAMLLIWVPCRRYLMVVAVAAAAAAVIVLTRSRVLEGNRKLESLTAEEGR